MRERCSWIEKEVMYNHSATVIFLIAGFISITGIDCGERKSVNVESVVERDPKSQTVYAPYNSVATAHSILSSAIYLDNLVAGQRESAGEYIWAFNVLLRSNNPKKEFRKLFDSEKHYARCYALLGMKISGDEYYPEASEIFEEDRKRYLYVFGCQGMRITKSEFIHLLDVGRIKPEYFKIEQFDQYLVDRVKFLKDSSRYMIDTGFGL
jgi:hypothetical protein